MNNNLIWQSTKKIEVDIELAFTKWKNMKINDNVPP